ncbi:MAG: GNAT family N-acetyltransferase [Deltaproteobacteria bacterium]|nr:GNAT family N-acetyltransferase [Deltaproteobacteria bacterium]
MPIIEIVRLRDIHLSGLLEFFKTINIPLYTKDFSPHPFDEDNAKRICCYGGRDQYYGITLGGINIIGYGMLRGWDEGYEIPSIGLCILKEYQGKHLGKTFMNFLEAASLLGGASKIMLKVKKDNKTAKALYDKQGFVFQEYNNDFLIGYKLLSTR